MVNHRDPITVAQDFLVLSKVFHVVAGIYIWEFVITLDYEWSVFRGRRQYVPTIWIYSLSRVGMLLSIILGLIGLDSTSPINCQAWATFILMFFSLAITCGALLIAIRAIAIWNKSIIIIMIAMGTWLTEVSFLIYAIVRYRASWVPARSACIILNTASSGRYIALAMLASGVILFLIVLLGLFRLRRRGGTSGMVQLLWNKSIFWLFIATVAGVPPTVFTLLNLNAPLNLLFQTPAGVTVTIATTRMYRSLTNFTSPNLPQETPTSRVVSNTNGSTTAPVPIPLDRMEVSVHTHSEQYGESGSQASQYGLYIGADGELHEKPRPGVGVDVERAAEAEK